MYNYKILGISFYYDYRLFVIILYSTTFGFTTRQTLLFIIYKYFGHPAMCYSQWLIRATTDDGSSQHGQIFVNNEEQSLTQCEPEVSRI